LVSCETQGTLVRSKAQSPLRITLNGLPQFSKVRLSMTMAFIDNWNGESMWVTVNFQEVWRQQSTWRIHGSPTCVGPYSDLFVPFTTEFNVPNGTSSLNMVISSNLKTGVNVASFGFTTILIDVLQIGEFVQSPCQYAVEQDSWFEISMTNWQPSQLATLECADGRRYACGDWFNRILCQLKVGVTCPAPRKLLMTTPSADDQPSNVTCCSLGKSCDAKGSIISANSTTDATTCEYLYNSLEDTSFIDIKIEDLTQTVQIQCGNSKTFKCVASQYGKFTCSFKDKDHVNRNPNNVLCPEPRNAIINGKCCNLGKGCETPSSLFGRGDLKNGSSSENSSSSSSSSAPTLITLAAFCGLIAISSVVTGAVVMYKRVNAITSKNSRMP